MTAIEGARVAGHRGAGLVLSSTSDTFPAAGLRADRRRGRIRRLRRVCLTAYNEMRASAQFRGYRGRWAFITLTYAEDGDWNPGHVTEFQKRVREHLRRRGLRLRMIWVAELTKRGRVHYHAMVWLPRGTRLPKPDQQGWWVHGSSRIEAAHAPAGYLSKYLSKGADGIGRFPKGLRTYAVLGLDAAQRRVVRWWAAPGWVREAFDGPDDDVRPGRGYFSRATGEWSAKPWGSPDCESVPGGGYMARRTREWHPSPWVCILQGPEVLLLPKALFPDASPVGPSLRPHDWRAALNEVRTMPPHYWRQHAHLYRTTGVPF